MKKDMTKPGKRTFSWGMAAAGSAVCCTILFLGGCVAAAAFFLFYGAWYKAGMALGTALSVFALFSLALFFYAGHAAWFERDPSRLRILKDIYERGTLKEGASCTGAIGLAFILGFGYFDFFG